MSPESLFPYFALYCAAVIFYIVKGTAKANHSNKLGRKKKEMSPAECSSGATLHRKKSTGAKRSATRSGKSSKSKTRSSESRVARVSRRKLSGGSRCNRSDNATKTSVSNLRSYSPIIKIPV